MSQEEARKFLDSFNALKNKNTGEALTIYANACKASLGSDMILGDYEETWRNISKIQGIEDVERTYEKSTTAIEQFQYFIDMGLFPTPEILTCLERCFQAYLDAEGEISLDEAFFGQKHKKKTSTAFRHSRNKKFMVFASLWLNMIGKTFSSQEEAAEDFLNDKYFGNDNYGDVDTFLRDFRRYRESLKEIAKNNSDKK